VNLHPSSVNELARTFKEHLAGSAGLPDLRLQPYKSKDGPPSPHLWWLAPSKPKMKVSAFGLAKLVVADGRVPDRRFCGLHVERGYDSPMTPADERHTPAWAWDRVLERIAAARPTALDHAEAAAGEPLRGYVAAPPDGGGPTDRVDFELVGGTLRLLGATTTSGELRGVESAADLADFIRRIQARPATAVAMHWTDLLIGVACTTDPTRPDETPRCAGVMARLAELLE
jgi:hypothetical protein